jgi:hypothetical protein
MRRNERTQQRCSVRKQQAKIADCSTNPGRRPEKEAMQ